MAGKNFTAIKQKMNDNKRLIRSLEQQAQYQCLHQPTDGCNVQMIKDVKEIPQEQRDRYSDTTMRCGECGSVFEAAEYFPEEVNGALFTFKSMVEQVKLNAGLVLSDEEVEELVRYQESITSLETLGEFYGRFRKSMRNNNSKGNNNNRRSNKGGIGINRNMFGSGR